jgi:hypothetical protein
MIESKEMEYTFPHGAASAFQQELEKPVLYLAATLVTLLMRMGIMNTEQAEDHN